MGKALIIGAGGVAGVVVHKCCQNSEVFTEICIASRTKSKCDALKAAVEAKGTKTVVTTAQVDANKVDELVALIEREKPDIVINVALPYQDLTIMDACLATKVDYVDTANYEPEDTAKFEYKWQWAYRERFEKAGITALLGSGFDPGVTGVFCAYAQKHYFDEIHEIDILDCNGGDHGYPFATNFNPEINIREVSAKGSYILDGKWVETEPMEIKRVYNFDEVGEKDMYLLHHEELESLALNIKGIHRIRFFMTFGQSYLTHLRCLENACGKSRGRIRNKKDNNKNSSNDLQHLFFIAIAVAEERWDGNGIVAGVRIAADTFGNDQPVNVCTNSQSDCGPSGI